MGYRYELLDMIIITIPEFLVIVFPRPWSTASVGDVNLPVVFEGNDNIISLYKRRVTIGDDKINHRERVTLPTVLT